MKTAEAFDCLGCNVNSHHFSHDVSDSGLFLVASTQVLHLRENHPSQCGYDDSASDEHFHIRYRETPGRRNGYCLHSAPPYKRAVSISGIFDQRAQFPRIALLLHCPVADLRHVSPDR
jgi:hypothetical protein